MTWTCKRGIAMILTIAVVFFSSGKAQASLAPAAVANNNVLRSQDLKTVQAFLEQQEVAQHLSRMKLTPSEIESRLNNLSNQEIHAVATRIQTEKPGRDGGGAVVTVLLIGILVLLFVYLLKRV